MKRLQIRARDLVGRAGVGAIVEMGRESFVTTDISHWGDGDYRGERIEHERLCRRLHILELRSARNAGPKGPALVRFPGWMFCERCGSLRRYPPGQFLDRAPQCRECRGALIGMRWVGVCLSGHLFDVPWGDWAHLNELRREARDPACRERTGFRLRSLSRGAANYSALIVECRDCGAASSLRGVAGKDGLARVGLGSCPGTQPWFESGRREPCDHVPEVMMRASSRVHFPRTISMLEIPPEADRKPDLELRHRVKNEVRPITWSFWVEKRRRGERIDELGFYASELGCTVGDLEAFLDEDLGLAPTRPPQEAGTFRPEDAADEQAALADEWAALMSIRREQPSWSRFLTEHRDPAGLGSSFGDVVDRLVLVHRLREVRAYKEYRRISNDPKRSDALGAGPTRSDGSPATSWLPGHEVLGEGVFLNFRADAIESWADQPATRARLDSLGDRLAASHIARGHDAATVLHPWFVLLHTLSHLLVREMAFSAGYSAASLRERIYVGPAPGGRTSSGVLIYTAEGDSEGTLGGLVRLGEPERLRQAVSSMLARAAWCGQDPVCKESTGQGTLALNLAACHGCCLLPETSCVHMNVALDRSAVVELGADMPAFIGS